MNKCIVLGLLAAAVVFTAGCASEPIATHIQSDPPGARIEVNEGTVGTAPVSVVLPQHGSHHRLREHVTIRAYPTGPGQYQQVKQLYYNQWAPQNIEFDMTQSAAPAR